MFGTVGIDMVAGASEILVIADATANPDWVAIDLFSQAEHDELAQAILLSPDAGLLDAWRATRTSAGRQQMPRAAIIAASLARRGALIRTRDLDEACAIANRIAPEHLELAVADPDALLPQLRHAGAIFIGHHASRSARRLLRRPQPRAADGPHRALFVAARRLRFPEALEHRSRVRRRRARRSGRSRRRSRAAKAWRRMRVGRGADAQMKATGNAHDATDADSRGADVLARVRSTVRHDIRALPAYAVPRADGMVKLDAMENPYPLPADVRAKLAAAVADVAINRYPDRRREATKAGVARTRSRCRRRRRHRARQRLGRADLRC